MIETPLVVATATGVDVKTVRKWVKRFQAEGLAGLEDRSSRPHKLDARHHLKSANGSLSFGVSAGLAIDRQGDSDLAGNGQPCAPSCASESNPRSGAGRTAGPL